MKSGNPQLQARLSFLRQAAQYLHQQKLVDPNESREPSLIKMQTAAGDTTQDILDSSNVSFVSAHHGGKSVTPTTIKPDSSRYLLAQARSLGRKAQLRLPREMKQTICRNCDALLVKGQTCHEEMENRSKDAAKPWAAVKLVVCDACATAKRYPVEQSRQDRAKVLERRKSRKREKARRRTVKKAAENKSKA